MNRLWLLPAAWALAAAASGAEDCEALRARIEAKIAAAGVLRFAVTTVDAAAPAEGQVVGSCELGSKKIVYRRDLAPGSEPSRPRSAPMLTECKDGSSSVGGDCPR
ncbi:DUF1161 domain-containing protein [Variovorax saccharolyticus]|uniref:DUF1161 domain-containing protein n=1 Tax=Variovorax saccharolyticus TaxID=3053516 RepID=UPI0025758440|nr:DUF1161 domain-containing protein [Variovorax sp. J22R187]MDM0018792.1 DUF1161 domain-containing protein [Variovorax sp. J22R187]